MVIGDAGPEIGGLNDRRIFISHSSHDDEWATSLRHHLVDEIERTPGLQALVDERRFEAGDLWRPILYRWLGIADAAVLLLSRQGLSSAWVRKEATVLMWRRDLGSGVKVVPVLLNITMSDVTANWPAIEIDESQAIVVSGDADISETARQVLAQFAGMGDVDGDDALRGWIARVASLLEMATEYYLRLGAVELGLKDSELVAVGLHTTMSHALLHSDILRAEQSVRQTADGLGSRLASLVRLVTPVAIPLDVAEPVSRAMARMPGARIAVVPARYPETGPWLAERATCSDRRVLKVEALCLGVENSADFIFDNVVESLSTRIGVRPGEQLVEADLRGIKTIVLTLKYSPDDGVTGDVLRAVVLRISKEFPTITVVILAGSNTSDAALKLGIPNAVIAPPLTYEDERTAYMAARRMLDLAQEG